MKNTRIILGLITISILTITFYASVASAATPHDIYFAKVSENGNVFTFSTNTANPPFASNLIDPTTIVVVCYGTGEDPLAILEPKQVNINNNQVQLVMNPDEVHPLVDYVTKVNIYGTLVNSNTFAVIAPGFAFGTR